MVEVGLGPSVSQTFFCPLFMSSPSSPLPPFVFHRIQSGDMLVEVADQNMVGGALDRAIELLQEPGESIRLKIGRPDLNSSVFSVQDGEEVCGLKP